MRWVMHVARMAVRNLCINLVGRPRRAWEDNIRMDLREIRRGMDPSFSE